MAITKAGQDLVKHAGGPDLARLLRGAYQTVMGDSRLHRTIRRAGGWVADSAKGTYRLGSKGLGAAATGAARAGNAVHTRPIAAVPLAVFGSAAALGGGARLQQNLLHTDPSTNVTEYRPGYRLKPDIQYKTPAAEAYYSRKNIFY